MPDNFLKNVDKQNVLQEALKHYEQDQELGKTLKEILASNPDAGKGLSDGLLTVLANGQSLRWDSVGATGMGTCTEMGAGWFSGEPIPQFILGGTYVLKIERTNLSPPCVATLELYTHGSLAYTYKGSGDEKGLEGTWEGDWS